MGPLLSNFSSQIVASKVRACTFVETDSAFEMVGSYIVSPITAEVASPLLIR